MPARELAARCAGRARDQRARAFVRAYIACLRGTVVSLVLAALWGAPLRAQQHIPAGWEEGLFDVVATGLPQSSVAVLVTPRGKFLVPVQAMLDPLALPYRFSPDSG